MSRVLTTSAASLPATGISFYSWMELLVLGCSRHRCVCSPCLPLSQASLRGSSSRFPARLVSIRQFAWRWVLKSLGSREEGDRTVGRGSPGRTWLWGPATACAFWGRKSSPGWMNSSLNQATVFTLQASGKAVPLSHANICIYLNRGGSILLPSPRFQRNLASPESKQPPACFYIGPKRSLQCGV